MTVGRYVSTTEGHVTTHRWVDDYDPGVHTYATAHNLRPGDVLHAHGHRWLDEPATVARVQDDGLPEDVLVRRRIVVHATDGRSLPIPRTSLCVVDIRRPQ